MTDQTLQQTKAALGLGELKAKIETSFGGKPLADMTVSQLANHVVERVNPTPTGSFGPIRPYIYNITKCVRDIRDYKEFQTQYLESTGVKTIGPFPDGLELVSVYVSGPNNVKCVTDVILKLNNMIKGAANDSMATIVVDTGKLNEYTGGDIEPGQRKLVSITYITQDITYVETKRTHTPIYLEVTMALKTRDKYVPGAPESLDVPGALPNTNPGVVKYTGLSGSERLSEVYKVNEGVNFEETGGTYGDQTPRVLLIPTDTTNCLPGTNTNACP